MCPFCYIGKRHFEKALEQFPHKNDVNIVWKSFQLDPESTSQPGKDVYQYLAERKGVSYDQSREMHENVVAMAKRAGLDYDFDKAVIANSFDATVLYNSPKPEVLAMPLKKCFLRPISPTARTPQTTKRLPNLAPKSAWIKMKCSPC